MKSGFGPRWSNSVMVDSDSAPDAAAAAMTRESWGSNGAFRFGISNLSLPRKVALIPALTLLAMGLMLTVAVQMGEQNTTALRALDRDVFEPLNRPKH